MEADLSFLEHRLSELEAEHSKASRKLAEWQERVREIERTLEAFRLVAEDLQGTGGRASGETAGFAGLVSAIVAGISGVFTPQDVRAQMPEDMREDVSTSAISTVLIRMVKQGELEQVEKGAGKRQSRYERVVVDPYEKAVAMHQSNADPLADDDEILF